MAGIGPALPRYHWEKDILGFQMACIIVIQILLFSVKSRMKVGCVSL